MNKKKCIAIVILFFVIICITAYVYANDEKVSSSRIKSFDKMNISNKTTIEDVSKNKSVTIDNKIVNIKYKGTKLEKDIYTNENEDEYIYSDDKLVGFIKKVDLESIQSEHDKIDLEAAKKIADKFGKENIENFNKYQIKSSNYIESYNEYNIVYMYSINGIETQDFVKINVNDFGEVVSFAALHQGEFEEYKNLKINTEDINNKLLEEVQDKYGEAIKETKIEEQFLRIVDNELFLQSSIKVILNETNLDGTKNNTNFEVLMYEIN